VDPLLAMMATAPADDAELEVVLRDGHPPAAGSQVKFREIENG